MCGEIGSEDRQSHDERLLQRRRRSFAGDRREDEQVEGAEKIGHILPPTEKMNTPLEAEASRLLDESLTKLSITDEE